MDGLDGMEYAIRIPIKDQCGLWKKPADAVQIIFEVHNVDHEWSWFRY